MRLLLDTHILLWWLEDSSMLSPKSSAFIRNPDNTIYISTVSIWEVSIKKSLGKLKVPHNWTKGIEANQFFTLPLTTPHALLVEKLPFIHKDPLIGYLWRKP